MKDDRSQELLQRSLGAGRREGERRSRGTAPARPSAPADPAERPDAGLLAPPLPSSGARARRSAPQYTRDELDSVAALGHLYYEHRHLREAQVVFAGLMAIAPGEEYFARGFAASCLLAGDTDRALEAVNSAVEVAHDPRPALLLRAQVLVARRMLAEAERDLVYILRICDANPRAEGEDPVRPMATLLLSRVRSLAQASAPRAVAPRSRR
jgi:hypothetical protein